MGLLAMIVLSMVIYGISLIGVKRKRGEAW